MTNIYHEKESRVFVAGHSGMVGKALVRELKNRGYTNILTATRDKLDLINQKQVLEFFKELKPDQVYLAAAKVGGIMANNTYPADFIYQNLMIQTNVIEGSFQAGAKKLLFLGSSCIYPKFAEQPINENLLLSGYLEQTNEPYAIAKIAGIKLCESYNRQYSDKFGVDFRSVMPTNLYGPGDNYHPKNSHVIPALIQRFHKAKVDKKSQIEIWGTGNVRREFLHVDDMARACIHVMNIDQESFKKNTEAMCSHINVGFGKDISIRELAEVIKEVVQYKGKLVFLDSMPEGTPRKLLDSSLIKKMGWEPEIPLFEGLKETYLNYQETYF